MSVRNILRKKSSIVFAFSLVIVLLISAGFYASVGEIEGTSASDSQDFSIIIGEVEYIESRWEGKVICSYVTIFVTNVEKGQASLRNREVVVKYFGGGVDGLGMWRSDQPTFFAGEKVRLQIREEVGHFVLVEGVQGKTSVESDLQSKEARTAAGYKLYWFRPANEWAASTSRPGSDWYGPARWDDTAIPVGYWIDTTGRPSGITESAFVEYTQKCYQTWEDDPGSYIDCTYLETRADKEPGDLDYVNIFCWRYIDGDGGTLAYCNFWVNYVIGYYDSLRIVDADVALDSGEPCGWSAAATCPADKLDVQNIGTHEVGHGLGLADLYDSEDSEMTMYGSAGLGETKKRILEGGDIAGVRALYPSGGLTIYFPLIHDCPSSTGWTMAFSVQNLGSGQAMVCLDAYDNAGKLLGTKLVAIDPARSYSDYARAVAGKEFMGSLVATCTNGQPIIGQTRVYRYRPTATGAIVEDARSGAGLFFSFVHDQPTRTGWVSSVWIRNNGATIARVTISAYDTEGNLAGSITVDINPNGVCARYAREIAGASGFMGSIVAICENGQPISGTAFVYRTDYSISMSYNAVPVA